MKLLKASKGLVKAIACLVASVVLCIGVCLAWFAMNTKVDGNGMGTAVNDTNIKTLTVTAYNLKFSSYTAGSGGNPSQIAYTENGLATELGSDFVTMPTYGAMVGGEAETTALLLKVDYEFKSNLGKNYALRIGCNPKFEVGKIGDSADFKCFLSDAVAVYDSSNVEVSGKDVVIKGSGTTFTYKDESDETKKQNLTVKSDVTDSGALTGVIYCVIDYSEDNIADLYNIVLNNGGWLSSQIQFTFAGSDGGEKDIQFYMEEI